MMDTERASVWLAQLVEKGKVSSATQKQALFSNADARHYALMWSARPAGCLGFDHLPEQPS